MTMDGNGRAGVDGISNTLKNGFTSFKAPAVLGVEFSCISRAPCIPQLFREVPP
jgi:hypothetical protein